MIHAKQEKGKANGLTAALTKKSSTNYTAFDMESTA
jgi:hypothetical protein